MSRSVLLLQTADSRTDVRAILARKGWEHEQISDPRTITAHYAPATHGVGIAVVDDPARFELAELTAAMAVTDIEWIAVTTTDAPRDPALARILANSFYDYHTIPLDEQRLLYSLGHAVGKVMLRRRLADRTSGAGGRYGMVGTSPPMLDLYRTLDKIVRVNAPVLISGESGTGKEIVALSVHSESLRRSGPFVPLNCGAIPATLMQAQLFGHEKGAFTGAHQRKIGSIEAATGGTIFLDEIGDLPLESQASLLRFLQESTVVRIGSTRPSRIDARVIAATHVDLSAAVREGRFREDLYYRLNVLHIEMPPLRARGDDIFLLADYVFETYRSQRAPGVRGFTLEALEVMRAYSWPGNVRELINRVQKAMIMCEGSMITPSDLGLTPRRAKSGAISLANARQLTERDLVVSALERNQFNMAATARDLGVSRVTLYRLVERLSIRHKPQPRGFMWKGEA
ncbi:MAG: sigma 54-interacting transcriptional regulator [Pseudomonadota bacterium]